jgi:hypothetical protein
VDRPPLPIGGAHRSSASGHSGVRELRPRGGGEEGRAGELNGGVAAAREAVEGRLTGGGASAQKGDGEGTLRAKRERALEVWESSPRVGQAFIGRRRGGGGRAPSMAGVEGASMAPVEGTGYR